MNDLSGAPLALGMTTGFVASESEGQNHEFGKLSARSRILCGHFGLQRANVLVSESDVIGSI